MNVRALMILLGAITPAAIAATGPIAHWKFNESVGPTVSDEAKNFPGTLAGGAAFAPGMGIEGGALVLSRATNDHVVVGNVLPLTGASKFSIVAWVRLPTTTTPENVIIGRHVSTVSAGYFLCTNLSGGSYGAPGKAWFYSTGAPGPQPISTTSVNDDQWHQIVVTRDPSTMRIYVDGAPAEQMKASVGIGATSAPLLIAGIIISGNPVGYVTGMLDDIQIYNRVLSDADIDALFASPGSSVATRCQPDITHSAVPGSPGYGLPDCVLNNDDFFYFLSQFAAGNLAVADLTTTAVPGSPGYGTPNGVINNDDFFYYLTIFAAGC